MAEQAIKPTTDNAGTDVIIVKFADAKVPVFKESKNRNYVRYGTDNLYPDYLTYLYNKSAKHNAIINGKSFYIFGKGFANGDVIVNRLNESLNNVMQKCILDTEIYGGYRLEVIYNRKGLIAEIYHVTFNSLRVANDGGYYFKEEWTKYTNEDDAEFIPEFNPDEPYGSQIYAYNEYRPSTKFYPLPNYLGCNNYIETDIEISKYYLSAIRNGMTPSKLVQFFEGEPTEDKKREIERRFKNKFAGAENAGSFILVFSKDPSKAVNINDISSTELDKQFIEMNKTVQQEIFSGHLVTSPMLFGIKTEGQLGGNTELQIAYSLFQNTYAKPKAEIISTETEFLLSFSIFNGKYELQPTDAINITFDADSIVDILPRSFVLKAIGVPEDLWDDVTVSENLTPTVGVKTARTAGINDNLKNLTGKQNQQLNRIIRQYKKGTIEESAARTLLKSSLGLTDEEINSLLGIQIKLKKEYTDDEVIEMFDAYGDARDDFEILKSKNISFSGFAEAEADETVFIEEAFKAYDVTLTEAKILDLIKKDSKITVDVLATTLGQTKAFIQQKITNLIKRGYLEETETAVGTDMILERFIPKGLKIDKPDDIKLKNKPITKVSIKYSYEGPEDSRNRPFCAKLMKLRRLYTRAEIEAISERLGYSVFDRRGGFWRHPDGTTTPWCRHKWKSNIVIKKTA